MAVGLAAKLRLTAAVLGCDSHKALCARFRAANPQTHFELERAAKWLQGRAMPRNRDVYDDWVKVLGIERASDWLMDCPVDAFLDALARHYQADAESLRRRASLWDPALGDSPDAGGNPHQYLCGSYACYSWSWSPYYRGQIIRGALGIAPAGKRGASFVAKYSEKLLGASVQFTGDVILAGRTVHLSLRAPGQGPPLFWSLFLPGPPASVICGVLSGATYVGHEPQPSATPFIAVRVPHDPEPSNRYFKPEPDALASDLASLGLRLAAPDDVEARMRDLLLRESSGGSLHVSDSDQAALTTALDRPYLSAE